MTRDSNIPLFLWIATALLAHLIWGGGVNKMSRVFEETLDIKRFAVSVQRHVRASGGELEVALVDENDPALPKPEEKKDENADKDDPDPETEEEESNKDEATKKKEEETKK